MALDGPGGAIHPVWQAGCSRGATARRGEQVGESAGRSPRATGQYQDTGVMSNKHGICVGGGAGVGGLTSGGGHGGKQRSMLLNGPACPDILVSSLPSISYRRWQQSKSRRTSIGAVLVLTMSHVGPQPEPTSLLSLLHAVAYKGTIAALTGLRRMMPRCVHR